MKLKILVKCINMVNLLLMILNHQISLIKQGLKDYQIVIKVLFML